MGQISYLLKIGGEEIIKAFRRPNVTKLLNSLSAKGPTLGNKFYLLSLYFTGYHFFLWDTLCDNTHV